MGFDYHCFELHVKSHVFIKTPDVIQLQRALYYTVTRMSKQWHENIKAVNYHSVQRHGLISYDVTGDELKRNRRQTGYVNILVYVYSS